MKSNLKVLLFSRKDLKNEIKINFLKKKFKKFKLIYDDQGINKIDFDKVKFDFIISYRSKRILSEKIIKSAKISTINFHPGTPEYRGIGCANFAIMNNAKTYGFTIHVMDKKIDHGKILYIKKFKIDKDIALNELLLKTYKLMQKSFRKFIEDICKNKFNKKYLNNKKNIMWSKKIYKKKDLENLYKIKIPISKNKLQKILRATLYKKFKPFIILNDYKFTLEN